MRRLLHWFDHLPLVYLLIPAVMLGIAPWPAQPEPHPWEKLRMLFAGALIRPIDIFDLFLHATPVLLVAFKIGRDLWRLGAARLRCLKRRLLELTGNLAAVRQAIRPAAPHQSVP